MQMVQRMFMLILGVFFLGFFIVGVYSEKSNKIVRQWEQLQTERFIHQISEEGNCTLEGYILYHEALERSGANVEIWLQEYRKETDLSGKKYRYLISWEELKEEFWKKGKIIFQSGSVVEVRVLTQGKKGMKEKRYYAVQTGKGW